MRSMSIRAIHALAIPAWLVACSESTTNPPPACTVNSVTVTGAPAQLNVDATVQLTANVDHDDCSTDPTVSWSTSAGSRATVSGTGLVTGVGAGEVTITATAGGKSGTATFDVVVVPVASVRITPAEIVIGVGPAHTLVAEALDAEDNILPGRTFTWSVSAGTGATVSAGGALTGVTVGETTLITASSEGVVATPAQVRVVRSRLAFFWNHHISPVGIQVPDAEYSYNSLGGALSVTSGLAGTYTASFAGQGRDEHETEAIFVTAYATALGDYCLQNNWTNTALTMNCLAADGTPKNMLWTAAHVSSAAFTGRSAFSWIPTANGDGQGSLNWRYTPSGDDVLSLHNGPGHYTIRFEGLGRVSAGDREAVIVNGYGGTSTCQPASWSTVGADLEIVVRCFAPDGTPTNSQHSVLVVDGNRTGALLGFAHADQPAAASYTPTNSAVRPTGQVIVTRSGPGIYMVEFENFYRSGDLKETFLVSGTGDAPARCNIGGFGWVYSVAPGGSAMVEVECATPAGVAADLPFSIVALQ